MSNAFRRLKRRVEQAQAQAVKAQSELNGGAAARAVGVDEGLLTGARNSLAVKETFQSAMIFDFAQGNVRELVLTGNVASVALANLVPGGEYVVSLVQDATGGRTVAWGANVKWTGGAAPVLTAAAAARDNFKFASFDGATLCELARALDVK